MVQLLDVETPKEKKKKTSVLVFKVKGHIYKCGSVHCRVTWVCAALWSRALPAGQLLQVLGPSPPLSDSLRVGEPRHTLTSTVWWNLAHSEKCALFLSGVAVVRIWSVRERSYKICRQPKCIVRGKLKQLDLELWGMGQFAVSAHLMSVLWEVGRGGTLRSLPGVHNFAN